MAEPYIMYPGTANKRSSGSHISGLDEAKARSRSVYAPGEHKLDVLQQSLGAAAQMGQQISQVKTEEKLGELERNAKTVGMSQEAKQKLAGSQAELKSWNDLISEERQSGQPNFGLIREYERNRTAAQGNVSKWTTAVGQFAKTDAVRSFQDAANTQKASNGPLDWLLGSGSSPDAESPPPPSEFPETVTTETDTLVENISISNPQTITAIQTRLSEQDPNVQVTGTWDRVTEKALRSYQDGGPLGVAGAAASNAEQWSSDRMPEGDDGAFQRLAPDDPIFDIVYSENEDYRSGPNVETDPSMPEGDDDIEVLDDYEVATERTASVGDNFPLPGAFMARGGEAISSQFGLREAPVPGASTDHNGADYKTPVGTQVFAPANGTVIEVNDNPKSKAGKYIKFLFGKNGDPSSDGYYMSFSHLSDTGGMKKGMSVAEGLPIGKTGKTGNVSGPHLHLVVKKPIAGGEWEAIDPVDFFMRKTDWDLPMPEGDDESGPGPLASLSNLTVGSQ